MFCVDNLITSNLTYAFSVPLKILISGLKFILQTLFHSWYRQHRHDTVSTLYKTDASTHKHYVQPTTLALNSQGKQLHRWKQTLSSFDESTPFARASLFHNDSYRNECVTSIASTSGLLYYCYLLQREHQPFHTLTGDRLSQIHCTRVTETPLSQHA